MDLIRTAFGTDRDLAALFADDAGARALLTELLHPDAEFEFIRSAEHDEALGVTGIRRGVEGVLGAAWGTGSSRSPGL